MKRGLLAILLMVSLSGIILNVKPVFNEEEITHGQRFYETSREANAESRTIAVNEEDGRSLIKFVETARVGEWRVRFFLLALSLLVFIATVGVIVVEFREKTKRKHNQSLKSDAAKNRRAT